MANDVKEYIIENILEHIFSGYSEYSLENEFGKQVSVFIKHPSKSDAIKIYNQYNHYFNKYKNEGLMSQEEQLAFICDNGWWSKDKESEILYASDSIKRLEQTKRKIIYESDRKRIADQISDLKNKLLLLERQKSEYISSTAEDLASQESSSFFVENFIFIDKDFKEKINISDNDNIFNSCLLIYYTYLNDFSALNVKKAALSLNFQNMLYTSSGSCMDVFGVPVIKLTKYQTDLLMWGNYYQKLVKNCTKEVPEELYKDPDKFIEWYESVNNIEINKKNTKKRRDKKSKYGSESKFLFGEREEVKKIGGEISGDKILKEAEKSGGFGIYDLMEK
jgi:hypothetical protein